MASSRNQPATFASRIDTLLEESGLTQAALAAALTEHAQKQKMTDGRGRPLKVVQADISRWRSTPSISVRASILMLVADYWGVTTDWLVGRPGAEDRHTPWKPVAPTTPAAEPGTQKRKPKLLPGSDVRAGRPRKREAQ